MDGDIYANMPESDLEKATNDKYPKAQQQADMFTDAGRVDDLPLFSGTAPRQTVQPFVEREAPPTQIRMKI
jgi:hypothetical protein